MTKDEEQAAQGGAAQGGPPGAQGGTPGTGPGGANGGTKGGTKPKPPGHQQPLPAVGRDDGLLQLSPAALQQMLAAAVSAATATSPSDHGSKLPKFWEEEPEAWFSVFRGHFAGRTPPVSQLALFNRMLPLLPTVAVSLCRPLVRG